MLRDRARTTAFVKTTLQDSLRSACVLYKLYYKMYLPKIFQNMSVAFSKPAVLDGKRLVY